MRNSNFQVKASNIYSIPATYTTPILNEILKRAYKRHKKDIDEQINEELWDMAELTFSGMTMSELVNFLKYVATRVDLPGPTTDHQDNSIA